MTQIITINKSQINGATVETVNARNLHEGLGSQRDFSDWIKQQIKRAMLVEGKDYLSHLEVVQLPSGKKNRIEYHLTIEAGKHIAMLSGTEKGREVRDYFIECERKAKSPVAQSPAQMFALVAQQFLQYEQEQQRQAIELSKVQETLAVVEARTQPENKHFTVLGYANLKGIKLDLGAASRYGRKCAELSRDQGISIGDVSDPRFGRVHSYHESILSQVVGG